MLIGGVDIREIKKEDLMNMVSFVFQDSRLIKTSILENVKMAKPSASRQEVIKALKAAQCEDIIKKLPNGVDTIIGTKGRISFGRRTAKNSNRTRNAKKFAYTCS